MQTKQNEIKVMIDNIHNEALLQLDAKKAFPITEYVEESSVMHAREKWIKAKEYLVKRGIEVKPLINARPIQQKLI